MSALHITEVRICHNYLCIVYVHLHFTISAKHDCFFALKKLNERSTLRNWSLVLILLRPSEPLSPINIYFCKKGSFKIFFWSIPGKLIHCYRPCLCIPLYDIDVCTVSKIEDVIFNVLGHIPRPNHSNHSQREKLYRFFFLKRREENPFVKHYLVIMHIFIVIK